MARVLSTAEGTQQHHDFGPAEWALFAVPPLIWGCSFLLIAVGLDHFAPTVVTMLRIAFGAVTLAVRSHYFAMMSTMNSSRTASSARWSVDPALRKDRGYS